MNIYFLIARVENKYVFGNSARPWAHELTSQTGGELMSSSSFVSAALVIIIIRQPNDRLRSATGNRCAALAPWRNMREPWAPNIP